ncbi:MAG: TolC family protein, partial [Alphaproteobacteria bacterium]|nr:TolC family protein [Alphaproteobacteria bacterium]
MRSTSLAALAVALAGCVSPMPETLKPGDVPPAFTAPSSAAPDAPLWPATDWWTSLNAPELPPLEATAQTENLDLLAARARVLQAQANTGIAGSALFPTINLAGSAQERGTDVPGTTTNTYSVSGQASYELDLWGRNLNGLTAAEQSELASRYSTQTVYLTITANVATTYLNVLALRQRITIARKNIEAARGILSITE